VMPQAVARVLAAPGHIRTPQQTVKITGVEVVEDSIQIVTPAASRIDPFTPSHLPHQVYFAGDFLTGNILSIPGSAMTFNRLAVHLRNQDVRNSVQYRLRRALKQV